MPPMLQGHRGEVLDIDFNPFVPNVIATASDDTSIKVWSVPAEGLTAPITSSDFTLEGHQKKVTLVNWHPTASNVLMSCSADNTVKGSPPPPPPPPTNPAFVTGSLFNLRF
jgi:WD40 repeat protein